MFKKNCTTYTGNWEARNWRNSLLEGTIDIRT